MRPSTMSLWVLLAAFGGCASATGRAPDPGHGGNGGGGGGGNGGSMGGDNPDLAWPNPINNPDCSDSTKLVYLLDADNSLWSFQPNQMDITKSKLTLIAPLKCSTTMSPNSMSVDRKGIAWVEYVPMDDTNTTDDALYMGDVTNANCMPTSTG